MSNMFAYLVRAGGGQLDITSGTGPVPSKVGTQGLILTATGAVATTVGGVIDHYNFGLPFDVDGRLVVSKTAPDYVTQNIPFTSFGEVAMSAGATSYVSQGLPFDVAGSITATEVV